MEAQKFIVPCPAMAVQSEAIQGAEPDQLVGICAKLCAEFSVSLQALASQKCMKHITDRLNSFRAKCILRENEAIAI